MRKYNETLPRDITKRHALLRPEEVIPLDDLPGVLACVEILYDECPGQYVELKNNLEFAACSMRSACPGHALNWICNARCSLPRGRHDWDDVLHGLMTRCSVVLNSMLFEAKYGFNPTKDLL